VLIEFLNGLNFEPVRLTGFFNIVMVWNRGVSFGMFNSGEEVTRWLLTALAVAVSIGLVVWLARVRTRLPAIAIGLVIGGALGNALDRVQYGAVADFFDFHVAGWSWPAFNIADAAITVGVLLLVLDAIMTPQSSDKIPKA
jgi:signal peptidase II